MSNDPNITALLSSWRAGNPEAGEELMRAVYERLRGIAARRLSGERVGHTLQTADLVQEAYMRLARANVEWNDRVHFFAIAARVMRRILIDHARASVREKRGGGSAQVALRDFDGSISNDDASLARILALDEALTRLAVFDSRKSEVIELTFFGGMNRKEVAAVLDVSQATLHREMKLAKAWLHADLSVKVSSGIK